MTNTPHADPEMRLLELLAGLELGELSAEEHDELQALLAQHGHPGGAPPIGELVVAMDRAASNRGDAESLPPELRARLAVQGRAIVAGDSEARGPIGAISSSRHASGSGSVAGWVAAAAAIAILIGGGFAAWLQIEQREQQRLELEGRIAQLREQVSTNTTLLASARQRAEELAAEVENTEGELRESKLALAEEARKSVALAERLATAAAQRDNLLDQRDELELRLATLEAPVDPAELAANREKLLEVPGTVRVAWQPFDLPDAPAEQRGQVEGDVVWNDERETGYLRFVGLDVNDPNLEQYQVWVIDERGLEQKVSGGVFNASAEGEVIVPIDPGIDVGRVALFAITVENPGGTWVPDLERRIVVAPREDG